MKVSEAEKNIGIETFFTPFEGLDGKLRFLPEDFNVKEISVYPTEDKESIFTIAEVTSTNWETNLLVRELSNRLHVSRNRISFAGTKDKRAKTTQLMSFYNISPEILSKVKIKDVVIERIYRSKSSVKIGDLVGNKFRVIIRKLEGDIESSKIQNILSYIHEKKGFPNFYGIQRFGVMRPITHVVGRYIVKDDFEKAVMTYVGNPVEGEDEESYTVRSELEKTRDFSKALKVYPFYLNFERAILNKLIVNPDDFVSALKELPRNLLTMFVYAYQSYLFNKILSGRINRKIPLNEAVIGDIVLPIRKNAIDGKGIHVSKNNVQKVNKQISQGKALVSGILFGADTVFSDGEMGEIEHQVIDGEKIDPRDFIIPDIPRISSLGSRRPLFAYVKNLDFELTKDDLNDGKNKLLLGFEIRKGCYATSLLREFMKTNDIKNY